MLSRLGLAILQQEGDCDSLNTDPLVGGINMSLYNNDSTLNKLWFINLFQSNPC